MFGRLVFVLFTLGALALSPWAGASASDGMPMSDRAAAVSVAADAHRAEHGCPTSAAVCESQRSHSSDCSAAIGCGGNAVLPSHPVAGKIAPTATTTPRAGARVVVRLPRPRPFFRPPKA